MQLSIGILNAEQDKYFTVKIVLAQIHSNNFSMSFKAVNTLTPLKEEKVEPVGVAFFAHARRIIRQRTWSEDEKVEAEERSKLAASKKSNVDDDLLFTDEVDEELLEHDPKDWKSADQYAAIGLQNLRWRATDDQIRRAHRKQVLIHHPDKKAAAGQANDGFFKIIQKAFEILTDPTRRRQWDSVDKKANVAPPKKGTTGDFFDRFGKVFKSEGRFSTKQPVPQLGDANSTREEVDNFYNFWYGFDSWRTFEWLDEDVPDDSSNRDNKRYIEKKNKNARAHHKKDDSARLRKIIDTALAEDPRIQAFKEAEKKAKEQKKWEREAGARAEAEAKAKAAAEAEAKAKADADAAVNAKKNKEQAKSAKKKNKRAIRGSIKDFETSLPAADAARMAADVDALIESLDDLQLSDAATKVGELKGDALTGYFKESLAAKSITPKYF